MTATLRRNTPDMLDVLSFRKAMEGFDDYAMRIHQAARWYANNGFLIVPFRPGDDTGKYSGYPKGLSQRHATRDLKLIDKWWHPTDGLYSSASIAMAHGGQSGLCAVDLDVKDHNGIQNLADLQVAYGGYNDAEGEGLLTLMAFTPSGGRHLVFKYHPEIISNSEVSYPGIDTRGGLKKNPVENGGITFVEPSIKAGTGGKSYSWDVEHIQILDMPQWLVDVLNGRTPTVLKSGGLRLQDHYIQSAPGLHGDGRDRNIYMDLMRFVGIGYDADALWALAPEILARMDPPDEEMVRAKIESVLSSDAFTKAQTQLMVTEQVASVKLDRTDKGAVIKSVQNLEIILKSPIFEHEYGTIEYDDFTQNFVLNKKPLASVVDWSLGIQSWVSNKFRVDFPKTDVRDRVEYMAYSNPHINTARDYMLSCHAPTQPLPSDFWGSGRAGPGPAFKRLATEVLDLSNPLLHPGYDQNTRLAYEGFLWFWLQGVCSRACVPGCKMEIVLNIFGSQGIGKSLFFRDLCPDPKWFTDSIQDSIAGGGQNNRDELMKLHAKIIVEMPELNPMKRGGKSADDKIKQFISAQVDNMRRPYGHDSIDHPRTCALAGTANNRDIYRDPTGSRRFVSIDHGNVPIKVGDQSNGVMDKIRDSLWGEVVASFNPGELADRSRVLVAIPPQLRDSQNNVNNKHRFEEVGVDDVVEWMLDKSRITWQEVVNFCKSVPGLRDAKESAIITMVRKEMSNDPLYEFKKRVIRHDANGQREKCNCWVNGSLPIEKNHIAGQVVPPHWSRYAKSVVTDAPPEY